MSLIVFNGSPRGKNSNSSTITSWFLEGCGETDTPVCFLNKVNHHDEFAHEMMEYDQILLVFPLYVDGMPGLVKNFFECLYKYKDQLKGKSVTWIIHSGFSEAIQLRGLERYLIRFSSIMEFKNHGVIVIPGSEGFRMMSPNMTKKKHLAAARLAARFHSGEPFDESDLSLLRGRETTRISTIFIFTVLGKLGITNMYWNMLLKKNNAFENRFDAPYAEGPTPLTSPSAISK
jgi:multimeric flavodoxin WrbA